MGKKDYITIGISSVAFAVSAFATIYSLLKAKESRNRTIRELLIGCLDKMTSSQIEQITKQQTTSNLAQFKELNGLYYQKRLFLLDELIYLAREIDDITQPFELNTIAMYCLQLGKQHDAELFYAKSIERSSTNEAKALAISCYAVCLFSQSKIEAARNEFTKSLELLPANSNYHHATRGNILVNWASCESEQPKGLPTALTILQKAQAEYSNITNEAQKAERLLYVKQHGESFIKQKAA